MLGRRTHLPSIGHLPEHVGRVSLFLFFVMMAMVRLFRVCLLFLLLIFSTLKSFSCWAVEPLDSPYQTSLSPPCQTKFSSAGTPALALTPHTPLISAPPPACSRESNTWMGESQFFEDSHQFFVAQVGMERRLQHLLVRLRPCGLFPDAVRLLPTRS